jgi:hypothetical protein
MELKIGPHLEELELEQYSMGKLEETRIEGFEEHFIACESCQERLLDMEVYVNAMRSVSPKLRHARPDFWRHLFRRPRLAWLSTAGLSAAVVAAGIWMLAPRSRVEMASVTLQASRGVAGPSVAMAPFGRVLSLNADLTELPASPSYRLEVVDATGHRVWETVAEARNGKIEQPMTQALRGGQYYVRLYLPGGGPLLREFSLQVASSPN